MARVIITTWSSIPAFTVRWHHLSPPPVHYNYQVSLHPITMSAIATMPNGNGMNGHLPNGHAGGSTVKSSSAKSRGALKRLKAKNKAANGGRAGTDSASEAGTESERESDTEVGYILLAGLRHINELKHSQSVTSAASTAATSVESLSLLPDPSDPNYAAFASIFAHFQGAEEGEFGAVTAGPTKGEVIYSDDEMDDEEDMLEAQRKRDEQLGMTRRQRRKAAVSLRSETWNMQY